MSSFQILPMKEIVKSYDALLIDIWGVMYDGINSYPGAVESLNSMIEDNKRIVFLSNNPRPYTLSKDRFESWGIDMTKASIYTSGDAVREQLVAWNDDVFRSLGRKFYHLGGFRNKDILSGIKADVTENLREADFLLITVYVDEGEDLNAYDALLQEASNLKIPAVCANPDEVAQQGGMLRYCAGTFGKKYEELGGVVHYYGKPDTRIYNIVLARFLSEFDKSKILMIGDTIDTDILGATRAGIDSALVLTGNGKEIVERIVSGVEDIFAGMQAKPTWIAQQMGEV